MSMIEKKFANEDLEIELTSYIDDKQNVWFKGKDVARILGYSNTKKAVLIRVDSEDKQQISTPHASGPKMGPVEPSGSICTYINESGFYTSCFVLKIRNCDKVQTLGNFTSPPIYP